MNIRVLSTIGVCAVALALAGCTNKPNKQHETPTGDSSLVTIESTGESLKMLDDATSLSNASQTSIGEESQPYDEVPVNQQFLDSAEQDRLYVGVSLHIDEEALRAEFEEKNPNLAEDYYSWGRFLSNSGEQVIKEFVRDYNIDYEALESVFKMDASFGYELDKGTISSMLNDARVAEIIYYVGDAVIVDF